MIRLAWAHRVGVSQELDGCRRRIKMALGAIVCGGERSGVASYRSRRLARCVFAPHFKDARVHEAKTGSFVFSDCGVVAIRSVRPDVVAQRLRAGAVQVRISCRQQPGGFEFGYQGAT